MTKPPMDASAAHTAIQNLRWYWVATSILFFIGSSGFYVGFDSIVLMFLPALLVFIFSEIMEVRTRTRLRQYANRYGYKCCPKCAYPLQQIPENPSDISMDCTECGGIYNTSAAVDYWKSMTKKRRVALRPWFSARKPRSITDVKPPDPD